MFFFALLSGGAVKCMMVVARPVFFLFFQVLAKAMFHFNVVMFSIHFSSAFFAGIA